MEAQRTILGDAVVDTSIAALREKLAMLESSPPQAIGNASKSRPLCPRPWLYCLAETMDAEEVNELMNALWARLDTAIADHGGRIDKHMGDGVMALWGADIARENDPERAISER